MSDAQLMPILWRERYFDSCNVFDVVNGMQIP